MIETFTREQLHALITKAEQNMNMCPNLQWQLAYQQFILACSTLDAFEARASVPSCACQKRPFEIDSRFAAEIEPQ